MLTGEGNKIDHLVTNQCSDEKSWVLQTEYIPSWQLHSMMAVAPQQHNTTRHTIKTAQKPKEQNKQLKESTRVPNSSHLHPIKHLWKAPEHPQSMEVPPLIRLGSHLSWLGPWGVSCGVWHKSNGGVYFEFPVLPLWI